MPLRPVRPELHNCYSTASEALNANAAEPDVLIAQKRPAVSATDLSVDPALAVGFRHHDTLGLDGFGVAGYWLVMIMMGHSDDIQPGNWC